MALHTTHYSTYTTPYSRLWIPFEEWFFCHLQEVVRWFLHEWFDLKFYLNFLPVRARKPISRGLHKVGRGSMNGTGRILEPWFL